MSNTNKYLIEVAMPGMPAIRRECRSEKGLRAVEESFAEKLAKRTPILFRDIEGEGLLIVPCDGMVVAVLGEAALAKRREQAESAQARAVLANPLAGLNGGRR